MAIPWNDIRKNRPATFDWLVFVITMTLSFVFPTLRDLVISSFFSKWMLTGLVLYIAGIILKRRPLYYRLSVSGKKVAVPFLLFLLIGHWILMLMVIIIAEGAFRQLVGLPPVDPNSAAEGWDIAVYIFGSVLITWLAFKGGGKKKSVLSEQYVFKRELVADIVLIIGVSVLSFVFWEKGILALLEHMPINGVGDVVFVFLFLAIAYMLCYLPLRYLYLIEDHFSRQAWRRLLLIFILVLVRGLIAGM